MRTRTLHAATLAGALAFAPAAAIADSDAGTPDKAAMEKGLLQRPYSPYASATSRRGRCSAKPTCTPTSRSMPARSARGWRRAMPTALRAARRSPRTPASRSSSRGRWISSSSRTTPTTWASSRTCWPASPNMLADPTAQGWYDMIKSGEGAQAAIEIIMSLRAGHLPEATACTCPARAPYREPGRTTSRPRRKYNEPGRFTAFIGYEWTSQSTGGNNLHRNVIFRDNGDKASAGGPVHGACRRMGSDNPRDLWKWMAAYEQKTGGDVLAIAHNGNLVQRPHVPADRVFHRQAGRPRIRRAARKMGAALRGHPDQGRPARPTRSCRRTTSSPTSRSGTRAISTAAPRRRRRCSSSNMPARRCKNGLKLEKQLGTNPYKFGMVGRQRRPHRTHRHGRGQLLRQDRAAGTRPGAHGARRSSRTPRPA